MFYLIKACLIDNGFRKSAECFQCEAGLCDEYTVCDNISLETIIIEFEIFFYQRFKIRPQLCKSLDNHIPARITKRSTNENRKRIPESCSSGPNITQSGTNLILCNALLKGENNTVDPIEKSEENLEAENEYQELVLQSVHTRRTDVQWQDVKGADDVKEVLKEAIIYPIKYPHLFTGVVEPWKSILMYGPPGTGKTSLAHAVAIESNATFFNISSSLIVNKWRGETEKIIKVLFELAHKKAPSIIFIDEVDALALKRNVHEHEASRRMKSELFFGMDNLLRSNDNILVLATTNTPWDLDGAMLRRFEKHVYVPPPDEETRKALFKHFIPKTIGSHPIVRVELDYNFLSEMTKKYTGCDIKNVSKDIKMTVIRELLLSSSKETANGQKKKELSRKELENILSKFRPTFVHSEDMYLKWLNGYNH